MSDLAIASAAAHAVRAVPGVVDLSPGLITPAATYGSGQRVTGVVVHHLAPESVVLEIHVVLSESQFNTASAAAVQKTDERATNGVGVLVEAARQIRGAVSKAVRKATSLVPVRVDVLIDDLR